MRGDAGGLAGFLPTPSHGGRLVVVFVTLPPPTISTHALTWRATAGEEWTR